MNGDRPNPPADPSSPFSSRFVRATYVRNLLFGGEDSLVSTVGLLSGIAVAGVSRSDIVITGVVLIFVEALSMAVGSFLSENTAEEYLTRGNAPARTAAIGGGIMFISYFLLGFVPLLPYILWERAMAFPASITASIIALFILGWSSGREFRVNAMRSALKMTILGGAAILVGVIVGQLIQA